MKKSEKPQTRNKQLSTEYTISKKMVWSHTKYGKNIWPKMLLSGWVQGNIPRGRPRTSWLKKFQEANEQRSVYQLETMAGDRMEWRRWRHQMWDPTRINLDGTEVKLVMYMYIFQRSKALDMGLNPSDSWSL